MLAHPVEHAMLCCDLGLSDGRCRLDIHDDGVLQIDQIVGAVGKEGEPAIGSGPA